MKKVLPFIIVILLMIGVGGGIVWNTLANRYKPTEEFMDYAAELGLSDGEYMITLNHELLDEERAVELDGHIYLSMALVTGTINTRFYWDENESLFIYTTPDASLLIRPDEQTYTRQTMEGETTEDEGYVIVKTQGDTLYVAVDYVLANTQMTCQVYTDPGRLVIATKWPETEVVAAKEAAAVRYKGGIKSEVLRNVEAGEEMTLLESYDDWSNVVTEDGYVGWVQNRYLTDAYTITEEAPAFDEPVYTSIRKDYKINLAWHQVMSEEANSTLSSALSNTTGINTISPTWFYFSDTDGNVASIATQSYVDDCHAQGIEVWALFSNEFPSGGGSRSFNSEKTDAVLTYTSKRAYVIEQIIDYVRQYDIDGINIDFESITMDGADDYIQFIRELSIACRYYGIVLSIDNYVPKYTYYYNRREQGVVADYVVIMGYDEYTASSDTTGPVASISFVEEGITDTLAVVDASKVINAIPFYSRVWTTYSDGSHDAFSCGMTDALSYLTNHDVTPRFMETLGLNYGSYTSDIDGNFYEIWLQDETSVEEEMKLIQSYDLAGVASWKLGLESGLSVWETISSYLQ